MITPLDAIHTPAYSFVRCLLPDDYTPEGVFRAFHQRYVAAYMLSIDTRHCLFSLLTLSPRHM